MDKALAITERILNKENLNPKTWMKAENIKGFKDFVLQKESEETDGQSFDDENMLLESEKYYMEAAKKNDVDTMKLLGKSVNVNAKNVHDRTALHYAAAGRNREAVELLLQRRAKLDMQDKHGVTATHLAAWFGSLAILKLLIQAGADQKIENQEGMTIMHCAAINNHTDIVTYIVNDLQMKELDKEDQSGKQAFSRAAEHGCVAMMELLLQEPYSMATMKEDQNGNTPLHLAAKNGHLNAIQLLLQNYDTRNEVNKVGETPLYLAANSAYEDCVQALLEADCDPNIITTAKNAPLHPVAEKGYTSLVKLLVDNGADMNLQNQHLQAPFHLAVKNCHIPVIHTLLKAGCNTDITDHRGQTALHIAAELGKADVVEMILKADTNLSLRDKQEKTPLGVAARGNMVIIVDMIIKAERYFAWKKANVEFNETLHNDFPLTFKLDHSAETKQIRATIWNLAYNLLKPNDWKKLAQHWDFTGPQMAAIEEQWTGMADQKPGRIENLLDSRSPGPELENPALQRDISFMKDINHKRLKSYQEHGNRMMLIWLHGVCMAGKNATKELHESLLSTGYTSIADKIRMDTNGREMRKCSVS